MDRDRTPEYHDRHERWPNHGPPTPGAGRPRSRGPGGRRLTADARRRQLFEVALSLFAEHGYAATTMDDIAEAAGVTKPLVYQHFESKRALYLELMDVFSQRAGRPGSSRPPPPPRAPASRSSSGSPPTSSSWSTTSRPSGSSTGVTPPTTPSSGAALRRVEETIAEAIDPLIDAGLDPEHRLLLAHAVVGMAEGASRHWLDARREQVEAPTAGRSGLPPTGPTRPPAGHPTGRLRLGRPPPGPPHLSPSRGRTRGDRLRR